MDSSPTLYVYDIVKLELLLNVPSSDDDYDAMGDEEYTSQLILASGGFLSASNQSMCHENLNLQIIYFNLYFFNCMFWGDQQRPYQTNS